MGKELYTNNDKERQCPPHIPAVRDEPEKYRTPFRRDYARLIHSPSFRRLQGKTQLFPGIESDFFRNRLTHSLEVAQIAKSIALRINNTDSFFKETPLDTDLIEFAALAHDLGHPPFGHNGELALDECMRAHGGFEGNAQTLRILSRLEKREYLNFNNDGPSLDIGVDERGTDFRTGLNLTYRTLASILKYDREIPLVRKKLRKKRWKVVKGYYHTEKELVNKIKKSVAGDATLADFKTIECRIMDIADDIAYSTYDLEDALKGGFINPLDMMSANHELLKTISKKVSENMGGAQFTDKDALRTLWDIVISQGILEIEQEDGNDGMLDLNNKSAIAGLVSKIYRSSTALGKDGFFRTCFTSELVGKFIRGIEVDVNEKSPSQSIVKLNSEILRKVEVLKHFTFESIIMSPRLKVAEYRGIEIVRTIFEALSSPDGDSLLPDDFRKIFRNFKDEHLKKRSICDFIAGMTDRYAVEFYCRIKSENPQTIFKPIS